MPVQYRYCVCVPRPMGTWTLDTHHGHIDEAVETTNGHGGLGTCLGQGEKATACTASQDDGCGHGTNDSVTKGIARWFPTASLATHPARCWSWPLLTRAQT